MATPSRTASGSCWSAARYRSRPPRAYSFPTLCRDRGIARDPPTSLHRPPLRRRRRRFFSVHRFLRESVQPSQFLFLQHPVSSYLQGCQLNASARKNEEQAGREGRREVSSSLLNFVYAHHTRAHRSSGVVHVNRLMELLIPSLLCVKPSPIYCRPCHQFTADNPSRLGTRRHLRATGRRGKFIVRIGGNRPDFKI
jgi:hypothetical protein